MRSNSASTPSRFSRMSYPASYTWQVILVHAHSGVVDRIQNGTQFPQICRPLHCPSGHGLQQYRLGIIRLQRRFSGPRQFAPRPFPSPGPHGCRDGSYKVAPAVRHSPQIVRQHGSCEPRPPGRQCRDSWCKPHGPPAFKAPAPSFPPKLRQYRSCPGLSLGPTGIPGEIGKGVRSDGLRHADHSPKPFPLDK